MVTKKTQTEMGLVIMKDKHQGFEPGQMLHSILLGAFRAKGETLHGWCKENGITQTACRHATHGLNSGPAGKALLEKIIEGAGRETVDHLYRQQFQAAADRMAS